MSSVRHSKTKAALELRVDSSGMSETALECAVSSECMRRVDEREDTLIEYIDRKYAKKNKRSQKKTKVPRFFD